MNMLIRWSPFRELVDWHDDLDRRFEEAFALPMFSWQVRESRRLDVDVAEKPDHFIVKASVPGIKPEDLDITLKDNVLTIRGEVSADETTRRGLYHLRERRFGRFVRSLTLPAPIDSDRVEATHDNGVLTLRLPKTERVKPKRITVTPKHSKPLAERLKEKLPKLKLL